MEFDPFRFTGVPGWHVGWQDHLSVPLHRGVVNSALYLERMLPQGMVAQSNHAQHIRLRQSTHILLDAKIFQEFYRNPELFQESWRVGPDGDIQYVYFSGTELLSPSGVVHIPCLFWYQGHLRYTFERLSHATRANTVSLVIKDHPFK